MIALKAPIHFRRLAQQAPRLAALAQVRGERVDIDWLRQDHIRIALHDVDQGLGRAGGLLFAQRHGAREHFGWKRAWGAGIGAWAGTQRLETLVAVGLEITAQRGDTHVGAR